MIDPQLQPWIWKFARIGSRVAAAVNRRKVSTSGLDFVLKNAFPLNPPIPSLVEKEQPLTDFAISDCVRTFSKRSPAKRQRTLLPFPEVEGRSGWGQSTQNLILTKRPAIMSLFGTHRAPLRALFGRLSPLLIGLALLFGALVVHAQPILGIVQTNRQVFLFWPSNFTTCTLQTCTNLRAASWLAATDAVPAIYGSQIGVTVSNIAGARFFRLCNTNPPNTPFGMVLIPAGLFMMGDTLDGLSDAIPTNVTVSAFYMDTNLVTYAQCQTVYNYATNHGYGFSGPGSGQAANHPVQQVKWYDVVKWCNARSEMEGLVPAYYVDTNKTVVYRTSDLDISNACVNWNANGYRLPTEAEWEKAARGGLYENRFPWGDTISELQANYLGAGTNFYSYDFGPAGYNSVGSRDGIQPYTTPVGWFAPNGYGLFDMTGNVEEWCWDWYASPPYPTGSPYLGGSDPRGTGSGSSRVIRGAGWDDRANYARSAYRFSYAGPGYSYSDLGFRCVRSN
jgi:formylglycine-generating enzyme required for sulfatase activity